MNAFKALQSLGPIDVLNVRRDPMLRWIPLLPLVLALLIRNFFPALIERVEGALHLSPTGYWGDLMSYLLLTLVPCLIGMVVGFLLLDQRDDRTLRALQVTPLPLNHYLAYRLLAPLLASLLLIPPAYVLSGLGRLTLPALILCSISAAPAAPLFALFLAGFARNKIQGLALQKVSVIFFVLPLPALLFGGRWTLLPGLLSPLYWPARALWAFRNRQADAGWFLLAGLAVDALLLAWLLRRFNRVTHE